MEPFFPDLWPESEFQPDPSAVLLKQKEKEARKLEYSQKYKNCYKSNLTKEQKGELKIQKRRKKRKHYRELAKTRKKEFLAKMTPEEREAWSQANKLKRKKDEQGLIDGLKNGCRICIDCEFGDRMSKKELKHLVNQINFVYGRIRSSPILYSLTVLNYEGELRDIIIHRQLNNWKANFEKRTLLEMVAEGDLKGEKVVYLSPDAENELEEFKPDEIYVIGGLIDDTIHLNLTKDKARDMGVRSMRLPLEEVRKKHPFRPCLNVNTVFYIIDNFFNGMKMEEAILEAIPERFKKGRFRDRKNGGWSNKVQERGESGDEDEEEEI